MKALDKQKRFLELYEPLRAQLSRYARSMTRSKEDAHDLVSETTLAAYESFEKLRNPNAFRSYLFQIATRLKKRNLWRGRLFTNLEDSVKDNIQVQIVKPDTTYDVELLYKAMEKLPHKQRVAISLFEISGFSLEEVKDIQGGSLSGVKSRLKRARLALSKLLDVESGERDNGVTNDAKVFKLNDDRNIYKLNIESK